MVNIIYDCGVNNFMVVNNIKHIILNASCENDPLRQTRIGVVLQWWICYLFFFGTYFWISLFVTISQYTLET